MGTATVPDIPTLILVLSAGAMTLLSPCSFPLLLGYISYYIGTDVSVGKAFRAGLACTLGLLSVFSVVGAAVAVLGALISRHIPLLELAAGLILISMGIILLAELQFPVFSKTLSGLRAPKRKGIAGFFSYGVIYGLAAFGCSAPVFFSMLFYAIATGGSTYALVTFVVYAAGMGIPLIATTVLLAKAKRIVLEKLVRFTPWFQRIGGFILILMGSYVIYYYAMFLR